MLSVGMYISSFKVQYLLLDILNGKLILDILIILYYALYSSLHHFMKVIEIFFYLMNLMIFICFIYIAIFNCFSLDNGYCIICSFILLVLFGVVVVVVWLRNCVRFFCYCRNKLKESVVSIKSQSNEVNESCICHQKVSDSDISVNYEMYEGEKISNEGIKSVNFVDVQKLSKRKQSGKSNKLVSDSDISVNYEMYEGEKISNEGIKSVNFVDVQKLSKRKQSGKSNKLYKCSTVCRYWFEIYEYIVDNNVKEVICNKNAVYNERGKYIERVIPTVINEIKKVCNFTIKEELDDVLEGVLLINFEGGIYYENDWRECWGESEVIGNDGEFKIIKNIESYGNKEHLLYIDNSFDNIETILKYDFLRYVCVNDIITLIKRIFITGRFGHCLFNYRTKASIVGSFHLQVYSGEVGIRPNYYFCQSLYKYWNNICGFDIYKHKDEYKVKLDFSVVDIMELSNLLYYFSINVEDCGSVFFIQNENCVTVDMYLLGFGYNIINKV